MKAQEILNKIKEVVGIELSEEVSVQLEEIKLENGTILEAKKFESGQSVFIKTEEENIALPVGEYKLEDGRSLMVKEEGLIDKIMDKVEEKEEVQASEEKALESIEEVVEEIQDQPVTSPKKKRIDYNNSPKYWNIFLVNNLDTSYYVIKNRVSGLTLSNRYYSKSEAEKELQNFKKIIQ